MHSDTKTYLESEGRANYYLTKISHRGFGEPRKYIKIGKVVGRGLRKTLHLFGLRKEKERRPTGQVTSLANHVFTSISDS